MVLLGSACTTAAAVRSFKNNRYGMPLAVRFRKSKLPQCGKRCRAMVSQQLIMHRVRKHTKNGGQLNRQLDGELRRRSLGTEASIIEMSSTIIETFAKMKQGRWTQLKDAHTSDHLLQWSKLKLISRTLFGHSHLSKTEPISEGVLCNLRPRFAVADLAADATRVF